jgi:hypothetical protein
MKAKYDMAWSYEIRGWNGRLVQQRSGFRSEKNARDAGQRMKRMADCFCFPNPETLIVITRQSAKAQHNFPKPSLKYSWQRLVFDAFMEPNAETVSSKINIAERAISARLVDSTPGTLDERIALREALLALRRLLSQTVRDENKSPKKKESA